MQNKLSFDQLPGAIEEVNIRLQRIENILNHNQNENKSVFPERMSVKEVAAYLNIAVPTVYGLVYRREIPHEKRGKRLYFPSKEINEWLQLGKRKTIDEINANA